VSGRPGRSGGWNKLSLEEHRQRGTKPRYSPKVLPLTKLATAPVLAPEAVPDGLLDGLVGPGRVFVEATFAHYSGWTPASLVVLREAGKVIDDLESLRGTRGERPAQRTLIALIASLRLED
jgi:hypothetical protein